MSSITNTTDSTAEMWAELNRGIKNQEKQLIAVFKQQLEDARLFKEQYDKRIAEIHTH